MPEKHVRKCGFERPFSTDQIITWIFLVASSFLDDKQLIIVHCVHDPLLLVFLIIYFILGFIDPSKENSTFFCGKRETTSVYCRYCQKRIPGFDHHCSWLNTCIGRRNYIYFYSLATLGLIIQIIEIVYTLLMIIVWYENHKVWRIVLLSIYCILPVAALISYGSLWCFHTYTLFRKITTFQYLNRNRKSYSNDNGSNNKLSEEYKSAIEKRNKLERQQWESQHSNRNNNNNNTKSESNINVNNNEEKTVDTVATNNTTTTTQSAGDIIINIKDKVENSNSSNNNLEVKKDNEQKSNRTSPEIVIEMNEVKNKENNELTPPPPPPSNESLESRKIEHEQQKQKQKQGDGNPQEEHFNSNSNSPIKNSVEEGKNDENENEIELRQKENDNKDQSVVPEVVEEKKEVIGELKEENKEENTSSKEEKKE